MTGWLAPYSEVALRVAGERNSAEKKVYMVGVDTC